MRRDAARSNATVVAPDARAAHGFLVSRHELQAAMAGDAEEGSTTYGIYDGSILSGSRTESSIGSPAE